MIAATALLTARNTPRPKALSDLIAKGEVEKSEVLFNKLMVVLILLKRVKLPFPACTMHACGLQDFYMGRIFP